MERICEVTGSMGKKLTSTHQGKTKVICVTYYGVRSKVSSPKVFLFPHRQRERILPENFSPKAFAMKHVWMEIGDKEKQMVEHPAPPPNPS
eukprot:3596832-Ditylum_brightwellii.AAC.1